MSWEQERYAVERARDRMKKLADSVNDHCLECGEGCDGPEKDWECKCPKGPTFAGVTLQGEAASSDAEMLDNVVDFLKSLDGYDTSKGSIGFLEGKDATDAFVAEWNKVIATISVFCDQYSLPKPDMIFHLKWQRLMSEFAGQHIGAPLIYAGVRVRFGEMRSMDVLVS